MKKLFALTSCFLSLFAAANTQAATTEVNNLAPKPKILIAYYSYSGNTKAVAEAIQKGVGGDIFEIKAEGSYPEEYRAMTQQAKKEIQDNYRPKLIGKIDNIGQYDVIFLGSPNWWGTITPQVSSFLASYDLSGKRVIPFITHGGGGVQNTIRDLTVQCSGCKIEPNAWTSYGKDMSKLNEWLQGLKI